MESRCSATLGMLPKGPGWIFPTGHAHPRAAHHRVPATLGLQPPNPARFLQTGALEHPGAPSPPMLQPPAQFWLDGSP